MIREPRRNNSSTNKQKNEAKKGEKQSNANVDNRKKGGNLSSVGTHEKLNKDRNNIIVETPLPAKERAEERRNSEEEKGDEKHIHRELAS